MKIAALVFGVIGVLQGGLWLLQGLGLVHIPPILCVANCTPIEGFTPIWAIVGAAVFAAGGFAIAYSLRRPARR